MMHRCWPISVSLLVFLSGCAPTIRVVTPDPVKIDVNMSVDVKSPPMPGTTTPATGPTVAERRRSRMGEVQALKNSRAIGENRDGYLEIVEAPADPGYKAYADKVVKDENGDRTQLYLDYAKQQGKPLEIIERDYARQWAERAYPGEYIQGADGKWSKR